MVGLVCTFSKLEKKKKQQQKQQQQNKKHSTEYLNVGYNNTR